MLQYWRVRNRSGPKKVLACLQATQEIKSRYGAIHYIGTNLWQSSFIFSSIINNVSLSSAANTSEVCDRLLDNSKSCCCEILKLFDVQVLLFICQILALSCPMWWLAMTIPRAVAVLLCYFIQFELCQVFQPSNTPIKIRVRFLCYLFSCIKQTGTQKRSFCF